MAGTVTSRRSCAALGRLVGAAALAACLAAGGVPGAGASDVEPLVVRPGAGIGPISIGDPRESVERRLGHAEAGTSSRSSARYRAGGAVLLIGFKQSRVTSIATRSRTATLYGRALGASYRGTVRRLRRRGWTVKRCETQQAASRQDRRAGTVVRWEKRTFASVELTQASVGLLCGAGSPATPVE